MWKRRVTRKKEELESVPFPRARVKLGGRVSSYQVTQPLTYIFEPLTVAEIQGLLQTLFMYAQCQHPQPLVTWRGHHVHFLMFGKDKIHWQVLLLSYEVVWGLTFLTFDLFSVGRMKRSLWTFFDVWPRWTHWQCYFYHFTLFAIWPFLTFDPLTIGQVKRSLRTLFDVWPRPTLWQCWFCHLRLFKIWPHFWPFWPLTSFP